MTGAFMAEPTHRHWRDVFGSIIALDGLVASRLLAIFLAIALFARLLPTPPNAELLAQLFIVSLTAALTHRARPTRDIARDPNFIIDNAVALALIAAAFFASTLAAVWGHNLIAAPSGRFADADRHILMPGLFDADALLARALPPAVPPVAVMLFLLAASAAIAAIVFSRGHLQGRRGYVLGHNYSSQRPFAEGRRLYFLSTLVFAAYAFIAFPWKTGAHSPMAIAPFLASLLLLALLYCTMTSLVVRTMQWARARLASDALRSAHMEEQRDAESGSRLTASLLGLIVSAGAIAALVEAVLLVPAASSALLFLVVAFAAELYWVVAFTAAAWQFAGQWRDARQRARAPAPPSIFDQSRAYASEYAPEADAEPAREPWLRRALIAALILLLLIGGGFFALRENLSSHPSTGVTQRVQVAVNIPKPKPAPLPVPPPAPPVATTVHAPDPAIHFSRNSAIIEANHESDVHDALDKIRTAVGPAISCADATAQIRIVGQADRMTGSRGYNLALSRKRADVVRRALMQGLGLANCVIPAEGTGDLGFSPEGDEISASPHRRAVITIKALGPQPQS
jgi:outer membrane protein OmpA-like peptidoglycan-associated protein